MTCKVCDSDESQGEKDVKEDSEVAEEGFAAKEEDKEDAEDGV